MILNSVVNEIMYPSSQQIHESKIHAHIIHDCRGNHEIVDMQIV